MKIERCRSCGSEKLRPILSLGDQKLSEFSLDDHVPDSYPLGLVACGVCTLLQLDETPPLSSLYTENYGYRSGINNTMREHLAGIVMEATRRVNLQEGDIVVDIGANDGTLLSNYPKTVIQIGR